MRKSRPLPTATTLAQNQRQPARRTSRSSTTRLSLKCALTWRLAASNDIRREPFQDAMPWSHAPVRS